MAEVRTPPVTATHFATRDEFFADRTPGAVYVARDDDGSGEVSFWYRCPCGCGSKAPLMAGKGFKPSGPGATWNWNGSIEKPTLTPSVHHIGHWHGWLTDGVWRSC